MIKDLVVDVMTLKPTELGRKWLQKAGVNLEDVLIQTDRKIDDISAVLSPSRRRVSSPNFYAGQKVNRILPGADAQIRRILSLLKVAAVIHKERYEEAHR